MDYPSDAFEVVVVDDGGCTPLEDVVSAFRGAVAVSLLAQDNCGPASGRNRGARAARYEFLAFTDDDCEPEPGWLRALGARLRGTPDALVGGRTRNGLPHNSYSNASQLILDMVYAFYNAEPGDARFFATNNLAVRAALFHEAGGLDERFRVSEDREFCDRWRHEGRRLIYEPDAVIIHRHPLTLANFWRQHFRYGRGAARFHRAAGARRSGRLGDHVGFHLHLPRWWRQARTSDRTAPGVLRMLPHLVLWQLANACGFVWELVCG
jgi:GT2 family glycosyltransferase